MRMVSLASCFLVALAVAEATPQFGGGGNFGGPPRNFGTQNSGSSFGASAVSGFSSPSQQTFRTSGQFGGGGNFGGPPRNFGTPNSGSSFGAPAVSGFSSSSQQPFGTSGQFGGGGNFGGPPRNFGTPNSGSLFGAPAVSGFSSASQQPFGTSGQFGGGGNFGGPTLNGFPNSNFGTPNSGSSSGAPAVSGFSFPSQQPFGTIGQAMQPVQPSNTCDSGCECTDKGGLCIPAHLECTIPGGSDCMPNKGCKCCLQPKVYKQDIENTVAFFLKYFAPHDYHNQIYSHTKQKALKNIIEVFAKHLPLEKSTVSFLNCLSRMLPISAGSITGSALKTGYTICINRGLMQPQFRKWIGCKNYVSLRNQSFRSYPCGVWTTFHTITVNLKHENPLQQALPTLHDFVRYFPWCPMCQRDFLSMYKDKNLDGGAEGLTGDAAVMWLWKGHNRVTARTATSFTKPNANIWEDDQCSAIGVLHTVKNLTDCQFLCKEEQRCTAINYSGNISSEGPSQCQLRGYPQCGYPAPEPLTRGFALQGYAIDTGCGKGSDKGRSHWQFPGVHQCLPCQSSRYRSPECRFRQIHQVDGCFDRKAVLKYLKTIYSTAY